MLDFFDIKRLESIYRCSNSDFGYSYHFHARTAEVYLVYDIYCDAQYIICYSLKKDKGVWILVVKERIRTCMERECDPEIKVAGHSQEEAVNFMVEYILEKPTSHKAAKVEVADLEARLREHLVRHFADQEKA